MNNTKTVLTGTIKDSKSEYVHLTIGGKNSKFSLDYYLEECGLPCLIIIDNEKELINSRAPIPSQNVA